jgi:hypothetical protein
MWARATYRNRLASSTCRQESSPRISSDGAQSNARIDTSTQAAGAAARSRWCRNAVVRSPKAKLLFDQSSRVINDIASRWLICYVG